MRVAELQSCRVAVGCSRKWTAVVGLGFLLAAPLRAQTAPAGEPGTPPAIKWGKWAAATLAVGFTALGIHRHNAGDAAFNSLIAYCRDAGPCSFASDGRYANAQAEARYQQAVRDDRTARAWLIGGQIAALGSAVMFVLELTKEREPANVPYSGPFVEAGPREARIGVRVPLR